MQKMIRRGLPAVFIAILTGALPMESRAAQQTATWLGGNGDWSDATKWSGGIVPNKIAGTTDAVNIDGGNAAPSEVRLDPQSTFGPDGLSLGSLNIDTDDTLFVRNGKLTITSILGLSGILIPSENTAIWVPADTHLSTGTIRFDSESSYDTSVSAAGGTLTIDPGITIQNEAFALYPGWLPTIGSPNAKLVNRAHLIGGPNGGFALDGSTIENSGVLEVVGNGMIGFKGEFTRDSLGPLVNNGGSFGVLGTLENAGQKFPINNATGQWYLTGTIHGGTIETGDGLALRIPFSAIATLDNVAVNGRIVLEDRLEIPAGQTLSGNGEIVISGAEAPEGDGTIRTKSGTTIIGSGMTIRGGVDRSFPAFAGQAMIGNPGSTLVNHGIIHVDPISQWGNGQSLQLAGKTTNDGTLEVTSPSTIRALGDLSFAAGGKLVIDGGGELDVFGNLELSTDADFLDVYPQANGQPYDQYLIATYGGIVSGIFDHVTSGITVDYSTPGQILISGTPVPEPAGAVLEILAGVIILRIRRSPKAR
jgi:hypothetical protein